MRTQTKEKGRTASRSKLACTPNPETVRKVRIRSAPIIPQNKLNANR